MQKFFQKSLAIFVVFVLLFGISVYPARAQTAAALAATINAVDGLSATVVGNTVNVTGSEGGVTATTTLTLNIDSGVTVNWGADYSGALSPYTIVLNGSGEFNLASDKTIANSGNGGTIYISGKDSTLNIYGNVENTGSGSAVTVAANITGVTINVDRGTVSSTPGGYAISEGGTQVCSNNTRINISNYSTILAGAASAIQSTGSASVVTVIDSTVTNAATTNTNPTIYMNGGTGDNVIIGGRSLIQTTSTSNTSYVIQTTGNVLVKDDAQVSAKAGRAINLVGMNSVALVTGGVVSATTGIAISTATTNPGTVTNAKIVIQGGWVYTESGAVAVQTTGTSGNVEISGGMVTATTGLAVKSSGTATISGGFVFAYGLSTAQVVSATNTNFPTVDGVVIAWNNASLSHIYYEYTLDDLQTDEIEGAAYYWFKNGMVDGIYYQNGSTEGFFPLDVTVNSADTQPNGLIFDIASGKFYTGSISVENEYTDQDWSWTPDTLTLTIENFTWLTDAPIALTITGGPNIIINLIGVNSFTSIGKTANSAGISSTSTNITIKGTGTLNASASAGMGIDGTERSFTIENGTVNATSGNLSSAHGMSVGVLTMNGGILNASSGSPATTGAIYGINATELIRITKGDAVITASGNSRAINSAALSLPGGYGYFKGTKADGSNANVFNVPGDAGYTYSPTNRYVQIQAHIEHELIVYNGTDVTGKQFYFAGEIVEISTDLQLAGPFRTDIPPYNVNPLTYPNSIDVFIAWIGGNGGIICDTTSISTTFIMPNNDAQVEADTQTAYLLHIDGGGYLSWDTSSSLQYGYFTEGAGVRIRNFGQYTTGSFDRWYVKSGGDDTLFADPYVGYTVFTMPGKPATIESPPIQSTVINPKPKIEVVNGTVDGGTEKDCDPGTLVNLVANPPATGKVFDYWLVEQLFSPGLGLYPGAIFNINSPTTSFTMSDGNIRITAMYKDIEYQLTVIGGDGSGTYNYGDEVNIEATPLIGYTFDGWEQTAENNGEFDDIDSASTIFTMPDCDVIITAKWKAITYEVTFESCGGTVAPTSKSVTYNAAYGELPIPTKDGDIFLGWHLEEDFSDTAVTAATIVATAGDHNLYAKWTADTYTVTYVPNGGDALDPPSKSVTFDAAYGTLPTPSRTGYTFGGWFLNADCTGTAVTAATIVITAGDHNLYAKWTLNTVQVVFKDWNNYILKVENVLIGGSASAPPNPYREGYTFIGWDRPFNNVQTNLDVYALYKIATYIVTFEDHDGTVLKTEEVEYGGDATPPSSPLRSDYTFVGWNGSYTNVTSNTTVTAMYTSDPVVVTYTVTFIDYDEKVLKTQPVVSGANATPPTDPYREGYTFTGWQGSYTNVTSNTTVTAQYTKNVVPDDKEKESDNSWLWWIIGGLSAAALLFLFWFLLFYRRTYEVTFMTSNREKIKSIRVGKDRKINLDKCPNNITQWYLNSSLSVAWDFENDKVNEDVTLYCG